MSMKKPVWMDKENLYHIIFGTDSKCGKIYDVVLMILITLSILVTFIESVPSLAFVFKTVLEILEALMTVAFTFDYVARLYCARNPKQYAFSFFGIIDFLSTIPPYLVLLFPSARYMILLRTFRFIRVFRVFKLFTFINEGYLLMSSLRRSMNKILVYFIFVVILVICLGTLMYMVEGNRPGTQFTDLGTSVYYAIVTMTTVGYGDITPVTPLGRLFSAFVMLLGYTIIAIPTGIVTATFVDETNRKVEKGKCPRCGGKVGKKDRYCSHCGEKL
ncbi:voltage-gated potassium channel [Segatella bryantii]|uniref:ion transporter n=1 Tax=Segatella bryantii TaxID=77095 RepID=UPI000899F6A7|nr:ion transporter [Segatella bryantii]SDZ84326.1 voltage-gated potassium channel [Segatella bryantii]